MVACSNHVGVTSVKDEICVKTDLFIPELYSVHEQGKTLSLRDELHNQTTEKDG
jgi:hypothetical protein